MNEALAQERKGNGSFRDYKSQLSLYHVERTILQNLSDLTKVNVYFLLMIHIFCELTKALLCLHSGTLAEQSVLT